MIIPERHNEDHSLLEGVTHDLKTTELSEAIVIVEYRLLSGAELVRDGVECTHSRNVRLGILDDTAVLDVNTADLNKITSGLVVVGEELRDNSYLLRGVDSHALSEECLITHTERVEVAAVLVTDTGLSVVAVAAVSLVLAAGLSLDAAYVRGDCRTHGVGFPDIHFIAACSELSLSSVRIVRRTGPALNVSLLGNK